MWKTMRNCLVAGGVALTIVACIAEPAQVARADNPDQTRITLILISDIYKMSPERGRGGLARIASVLKAEKAANTNSITAHAGDTLSPSLMSSFDKGAHIVDLFNMTPLDIFVPGNHEFDFGPEVFQQRMSEFKAAILAANLKTASGQLPDHVQPSQIFAFGHVKAGVVGLTDENSVTSSKPGNLKFENSIDVCAREASKLRSQGADLVVAVAHAGRDRDEALFNSGCADIILSGHDHDLYMRFNGKTAIAEAGEDGMAVVAIDLDISVGQTSSGARKVSWWPQFRFIDTAKVAADPSVEAQVAAYESRLGKELDVPVGKTTTDLDSRSATVRSGEAAIGNLVTDAIRQHTGADIALLNGGGFRGNKTYPAGSTLTRRDILNELPFLNKAIVLEVSGKTLMRALEQGFAGAENSVGRFPHVSGLKVRADVTRPEGKRLVSVTLGNTAVRANGKYRLVTNDYLASGGDGYAALRDARVLTGEKDADLVTTIAINYIERQSPVSPKIEGRVIVARATEPK